MRPLDPIKENAIIQAVFTIAGTYGLAGITTARISKEAGIGLGSLYTYFKTKEELIQEAYFRVEHVLTQKMYEGFDSTAPIKISLRSIYFNTLKYRLKHYNETIFIDQYIQSNYVQLNLEKQLRDFEFQHKPLYNLIEKGQKEGILVGLPSFTLINFINGAIRSTTNGMVQKLIPLKREAIEGGFRMMWKGISS